MKKNLCIALIANFGIVFQNIFEIHGWIFYLLFTTFLLLVKDTADIFKLVTTFLLGILLSIGIWQFTGMLIPIVGSLKIAMPIASFIGILIVLSIKKFEVVNMSAGFFIGLVAYYGIGRAPSEEILLSIIIPALLGILFAFFATLIEEKFKKTQQIKN
jgi:hypothetical protein